MCFYLGMNRSLCLLESFAVVYNSESILKKDVISNTFRKSLQREPLTLASAPAEITFEQRDHLPNM